MIIKLNPAFKDYLWGGTKLRDIYHKNCDFKRVAESWELSAHSAGESTVEGGEYAGLTLTEFIKTAGIAVLGSNCAHFENFPVLIKFIDAKSPLSIQVHPSDEYALRVEHEYGKTEMWYVMDCEEGASLYFGVNREISKEEFKSRIEDNTILEVLNKVEVKKGDVFFIEAGTIHAIGAGILICEIQQNSNTTYRVYDYARRDDNGNLRELHVDKAIDVSTLIPSDVSDKQGDEISVLGGTEKLLGKCKYFTTEKLIVHDKMTVIADEKSFVSLVVISGKGTVRSGEESISFDHGDSIFVSADSGEVEIKGTCEVLKTTV